MKQDAEDIVGMKSFSFNYLIVTAPEFAAYRVVCFV